MTAEATALPVREPAATMRWLRDRPRALLAAICALHAIAPLVLVGVHFWYESDETENISQVSKHGPALIFTAPRARGIPALVYPVAELTYSTAALRIYLAILSSVLLYFAFRPWLRLRPGYAVPLAAALFTSLWTTIYYGFEAMPNEYVAIGAVAAVAHVLLSLRDPARWRHLLAAAGWLAFVALVRPTDSIYLAVPLGVAVLVHRGLAARRRAEFLGVLAGGVALGWLEWVIEAFVSYGGLLQRLHDAGAENNTGLHMSLMLELRSLAGPTLCRPCIPSQHPVVWHATVWWFAVPVVVALGVWAARRRWGTGYVVLPTAAALLLFLQYVVTIDYAAPRFLLPTYALLSIPAAEGVAWLAQARTGWWQPRLAVPVLALAGVAHLALQLVTLEHNVVPVQTTSRLQYLTVVDNLRTHGIRPPCLVDGYSSGPISFGAGCADTPPLWHPGAVQAQAAAGRRNVAVLTPHLAPRSAFYADWSHFRVHGPHLRHAWYVYVHYAGRPDTVS